jgi:hypothetical protein
MWIQILPPNKMNEGEGITLISSERPYGHLFLLRSWQLVIYFCFFHFDMNVQFIVCHVDVLGYFVLKTYNTFIKIFKPLNSCLQDVLELTPASNLGPVYKA